MLLWLWPLLLWLLVQLVTGGVTWFAGGRDEDGLTLAYIDTNSSFCAEVGMCLCRLGGRKYNPVTVPTKHRARLVPCLLLLHPASYLLPPHALCFQLQALASVSWTSSSSRNSTLSSCGQLWISLDGGATFQPTGQVTYRAAMAENNGRVIYTHPSSSWDRNYGTRVYKVLVGSNGSVNTTKVRAGAAVEGKAFCAAPAVSLLAGRLLCSPPAALCV